MLPHRLAAAALAAFVIGAALRADRVRSDLAPAPDAIVEGVVLAIEDRAGSRQVMILDAEGPGHVLARSPLEPRVPAGWRVRAQGALLPLTSLPDADYAAFLRARGMDGLFDIRRIEPVAPAPGAVAALARVRERVERRIGEIFPEPHAGLLAGLLTGSRADIDRDIENDFRAAGLTHLLAISGFNVTLVIVVLGRALFFLPRRPRAVATMLGIAVFVLFVGAGPPVVRAAIMGGLGMLALETGRLPHTRLAILRTLAIMTAWNPLALRHDLGFQLSFLAVAGIAELGPILRPFLRRVTDAWGLRESLVATLAAEIATAPWLCAQLGSLSLVAPLSNALAAPFIAPAMLFGSLAVLLSAASFPLGQLVGYAAWGALDLLLRVAANSAAVPGATVALRLGWTGVLASYAALALLALRRSPPVHEQALGTAAPRQADLPLGFATGEREGV